MQAVIDCMVKSYTCYEMDPIDREMIRDACKDILTLNGLEQYQELVDDEEDLQVQWEAAVEHPELGVSLLLGQLDDEDLRAIDEEENWHDTGNYDETKKKFFLAYHQVQAHRRYLEENPDEVAHFRRFQLWYSQQVAGGHVPGRTPGDNVFWAKENIRIVGEGGGSESD